MVTIIGEKLQRGLLEDMGKADAQLQHPQEQLIPLRESSVPVWHMSALAGSSAARGAEGSSGRASQPL